MRPGRPFRRSSGLPVRDRQRLGHYLVLHELGRGGMGACTPHRIRSSIAESRSSFARRETVDSLDRLALLQQEARAAAALNHPNIVHLYSVEEVDGLLFITMELVQGRSLRQLLSDGAPLPLAKTMAFASQMAEGLRVGSCRGRPAPRPQARATS